MAISKIGLQIFLTKMLIIIDKSVLTEAQIGNQLAISVLTDLATAQRNRWHALWADRKVLVDIIKLPLGDLCQKIYKGVLKGITIRTQLLGTVWTKAIITFKEETRRDNNLIYIKPSLTKPFPFLMTALLTENITDKQFFKYIADWYLNKLNLKYTVSCSLGSDPAGGGTTMIDAYTQYAENENEKRFCLCIADSDIKADVSKLLENKLITESEKPNYGDTYKDVLNYECENNPFNCTCYCFENVMEVENLIPFYIIEKESNYKNQVASIKSANIPDLSYFDYKEGLSEEKIDRSKPYIKAYWKKIIFKNRAIPPKVEGFGSSLLKIILEKYDKDLSNIDDNMLTPAQLKEYEEIGKRVCSWCCTMSVPRAMLFSQL